MVLSKVQKLLLAYGKQSLSHQDQNGNTILHQMAIHDFGDLMDVLLQRNPQLAQINNKASHYPIHTAILNDQIENARALLYVKFADNLADSHGRIALHYAARVGNVEMIKLCCMKNFTDVTDKEKKTPIMLAAELGILPAVQILISLGARLDLEDEHGLTVFHYAVLSNNKELVQWLLDNTDLDINARDNKNQTSLDIFQQQGVHNKQITALLLEHGAKSGLTNNTLQ